MKGEINSILPPALLPVSPAKVAERAPRGSTDSSRLSFQDAVREEIAKGQELKLSAHAEKRLRERDIVLAPADLAKIDLAVRQAAAKGARESLIIYDDLALIANVRNKTIVTAVDGKTEGNSEETRVFTNIDSAVILR